MTVALKLTPLPCQQDLVRELLSSMHINLSIISSVKEKLGLLTLYQKLFDLVQFYLELFTATNITSQKAAGKYLLPNLRTL